MKKLLLLLLLVLAGLTAAAQSGKLSIGGRVLGAGGEAVPGATVLEKGTNNGTATNSIGQFVLEVAPNATLVISGIGFVPQQVPVQQRTTIDVTLEVSATDLGEIVVTGSRVSEGRSNILTTSPVDVISAREIRAFAQTDVSQVLSFTAPSFQSARQTISDGTDHIDPASLRGLGPDQTLVLVNGKRRHTSSLVNINGTVGRGSVGTDLNVIPPAAIKRIEVLRDGAAAQYGSDAIAGVINIQLKDDTAGVNVSSTVGQTYEGDGELFQADANVGIGLGGRGFVNVSGQFSDRGFTNRSGVDTAPLIYLGDNGGNYPSTANTPALREALKRRDDALVAQRGYDRRNLRFGNSDARNYGGFLNAAFTLVPSVGLEVYAAGGITEREGKAAGFARLPGRYSQQNDTTIYPNGFLPFIEPTISDRSLIAGVRGVVAGFNFDLSNTYGSNSLDFNISNSLNASLPTGTSPTEFFAGRLYFRQNTTNLGFVRKFSNVPAISTLNVAFGGEYRDDRYQIDAGEPNSYERGSRTVQTGPPNAAGVAPTGPGLPGAQVFPGYQPADALDRSRTNVAGYVDLESDITEKLLVGIAGRAENYSDFGSNVSGKASARFSILSNLAVRGTVGNGFRAPSLQQRYFNSSSTQFVAGEPRQVLTVNNEDPIVRNQYTDQPQRGFGVDKLKQETSTNYGVGLTARILDNITLTVDAYQIDIRDRIVLSTQFSRAAGTAASPFTAIDTILTTLPANRVVNSVQFFANAVDTRTRGIDVVASQRVALGAQGILTLTAAANFTETTVTKLNTSSSTINNRPNLQTALFDRQQRGRIENAQPRNKIVLSANYTLGKLGLQARTVRFGEVRFYDARLGGPPTAPDFQYASIDQTFAAKWVTDATISFQFVKNVGLSVGANNLFDVYPDQYRVNSRNDAENFSTNAATNYTSGLDNTNRGRTLYNPNQFGFNGGFYFARLNVTI